jgi:hypothetical protein
MTRAMKKRKFLAAALAVPLACMLSGCIYLVVGGIGAVGGYIVSPDTVEGISETETDQVWDAALEVLGIMGTIEEQNEAGGVILSRVSGAKIPVTLEALNATTTRVNVKARKAYLPRIALAQDVFVKIVGRLGE